MAFKSMVKDWKHGIDGGGSGGCGRGKKAKERKHFRGSHIAPEGFLSLPPPVMAAETVGNGQESRWANMPPELLLDIIQRVESSEIRWPARRDVVACASVCKSWRHIAKEVVKPLQLCGSLTFPISLKQPGPREYPVQCFIKRERATSTYRLYLGLSPALTGDVSKLLLAARKIRRATSTEFIISLSRDDFSRSSSMYVGKLRSNFLGIKFTMYDSQAPGGPATESSCQPSRKSLSKLPHAKASSKCFNAATISYELNVLRTRGPRRMNCMMHSIPFSSIQEGGTAPTPTEFSNCQSDKYLQQSSSTGKTSLAEFSSTSLSGMLDKINNPKEPLILKNKAPRWHEQLQCWCLNFKGRVTVASVKNFQLVAAVEPHQNVSLTEQETVILQFGKIGKDIFTMDYRYPLSALQAFAICLSSFDTKPACE